MNLPFVGQFINSSTGLGESGLGDVTIDIDRVNLSTGIRDAIVNDGATTEARDGTYYYILEDADLSTYFYICTFKTASADVAQGHVAGLWVRWTEGHATELAYLDAAISSRSDFDESTDRVRLSTTGVDDVLDEVVEGAYTMRQLLRLMAGALFGKSSGGGTTTVTFRDLADGTNRIEATVDSSGNRTAVTLDAS